MSDKGNYAAMPRIVCLCGSTRFYDEFQAANFRETMAGKIVLSVGFYPHSVRRAHGSEKLTVRPEQKILLDELHKRKIDLADEVLIVSSGGYFGDSTTSEIRYALSHDKPVRWVEEEARRNFDALAERPARARGKDIRLLEEGEA